jgi:hypothetical protein|tara:strand:+ start:1186 stop:1386 length:201 start_codon:yes stop_codon:yes gene_type:complete
MKSNRVDLGKGDGRVRKKAFTDKDIANYFDKRKFYGSGRKRMDKNQDHQQRLYIDDDDEQGSRYVP